jgi:hypothetical protein
MKFQRCIFKREKESKWEDGIASLNFGWGCHDVTWIVDADGNKLESVHDYKLVDGPGCYIALFEREE